MHCCIDFDDFAFIYSLVFVSIEKIYQTVKSPGLKVNDQLVACATRVLAAYLKNHVWLHHCALKAKVQCDFSIAYSLSHKNIL